MANPRTDRFILPDEKTARRYGLLNVMFGSILIFMNLWMAIFFVTADSLGGTIDFAVAAGNAAIQKERQNDLVRWQQIEANSTDATLREDAREKIKQIQARPVDAITASTMGLKALQDRRVKIYNAVETASGLALNGLMILAGAALIGLREWGRKAALAVAGIKLVRLAVLVGVSVFVMVPIQVASMSKELIEVKAQMNGAAASPAMVMISPQWISAQSMAGLILNALVASIYPILLLIKLNNARVRAACHSAAKPMLKENAR